MKIPFFLDFENKGNFMFLRSFNIFLVSYLFNNCFPHQINIFLFCFVDNYSPISNTYYLKLIFNKNYRCDLKRCGK